MNRSSSVINISNTITRDTTLFWLRRDLRLEDNAGLYHALKENTNVLPVFIFDTTILDTLEDKADLRVEFIHQSLEHLKQQLEELGCTLLYFTATRLISFGSSNQKLFIPTTIMNHTPGNVISR